MKIKNYKQIAKNKNRIKALQILEAGYQAIDTEKIIKDSVFLDGQFLNIKGQVFDLNEYENLYIVGIGKCASAAGVALERILKAEITGGIVFDVKKDNRLKRLKSFVGDHPFPTQNNIDITAKIIDLLSKTTAKDLVIVIVSGGGSTLLCAPKSMVCQDERLVLEYLFKVGATISEINTVRKHMSRARGGQLAKYSYPAKTFALIFSDVPGDDIQFVASGPTVKDKTTKKDAEKILHKYQILENCGAKSCGLIETPKTDKYFAKVSNILLVSNTIALKEMAKKAKELGFKAIIKSSDLSGEAAVIGRQIVKTLHKEKNDSVLLYGGETTVTLHHKGKGGRSQQLALAVVDEVQTNEVIIAAASDGRDNSDFAGAIVDKHTQGKAIRKKINTKNYLDKNNPYPFFENIDDYILTGQTGSNVSDFVIALKG